MKQHKGKQVRIQVMESQRAALKRDLCIELKTVPLMENFNKKGRPPAPHTPPRAQ